MHIVLFCILLGYHYSLASENTLSPSVSSESIEEALDHLGLSIDGSDEFGENDETDENNESEENIVEFDPDKKKGDEMIYGREPAGSSRKSRNYYRRYSSGRYGYSGRRNYSGGRRKSYTRSRSTSRSSSRSGCSPSVTLSQNQEKIMKCLEEASVKSPKFIKNLLQVERHPGTAGYCARSVANAAKDSGWTKGKPLGCIGREKTSYILKTDRSFIDLVKYQMSGNIRSFHKVGALKPGGLAIARIAPSGSIFSYYGNNHGTCGGRKVGLGHMMAKVNDTKFCHFICNRCPALPTRYVDKVLIKIKEEYRSAFNVDTNLDSICNEINVVRSKGETREQVKGSSPKVVQ